MDMKNTRTNNFQKPGEVSTALGERVALGDIKNTKSVPSSQDRRVQQTENWQTERNDFPIPNVPGAPSFDEMGRNQGGVVSQAPKPTSHNQPPKERSFHSSLKERYHHRHYYNRVPKYAKPKIDRALFELMITKAGDRK